MEKITVPDGKLRAIVAEVDSLDLDRVPVGAGRGRGDDVSDGWISGLSLTRLVDPGRANRLIEFPALASTIGQLMKSRGAESIYQVIVNRLDPGGTLDVHRDGLPFDEGENPERWHLPVESNPMVEYWEERFGPDPESFGLHFSIGSWWGPIEYWTLHRMVNLGETPRTHVIVDLIR